jgi:uncharacterized SAM-binding protein YcdF (DUF218 family)
MIREQQKSGPVSMTHRLSERLSHPIWVSRRICFLIYRISLILLILLVSVIGLIPLRVAIATHQAPEPQAILTLGGQPEREPFTAAFAQMYPNLDIWISSGNHPSQIRKIFQRASISQHRLHLDYRATDTVTNFTTLVRDFQECHIQHVYLITSRYHMPRASAIATLVLGSQGITFTPISVFSKNDSEPVLDTIRDSGRSLLWIFTGKTGSSLKSHPKRSI